jgi:hypothetical protein
MRLRAPIAVTVTVTEGQIGNVEVAESSQRRNSGMTSVASRSNEEIWPGSDG